jgi:hypothetical protein
MPDGGVVEVAAVADSVRALVHEARRDAGVRHVPSPEEPGGQVMVSADLSVSALPVIVADDWWLSPRPARSLSDLRAE